MSIPPPQQKPIWVLLKFITFITLVESKSNLDSLYDALTSNDLPIGLIPSTVKDFTINYETGYFSVYLDQACNAKFESELHYERNISGVLSYGRISELKGVQAQELFLWFPVNSIHVDEPSSGLIYFDVDVVVKQFSLSLFETPPECVAVVNWPDFLNVSVYKRKNGILRHQIDHEENGSADV